MNKQALRRIPLEQLMDLKVDFSFKQIFGKEKNKEITIVFLNAILQKFSQKKQMLFIAHSICKEDHKKLR